MVKVHWTGEVDTRVRTQKNGEKVDVKAGSIFDCSPEQADFYSAVGGFELVTENAVVETPQIAKNEAPEESIKEAPVKEEVKNEAPEESIKEAPVKEEVKNEAPEESIKEAPVKESNKKK